MELTNTASVKRLVFRVVPDDTTQLAMLKRGFSELTAYNLMSFLAKT